MPGRKLLLLHKPLRRGHFVALSSAATFSEEIDELSLAISIC